MHTKYFTSVDEVEHVFGLTFTPGQYEMVWTYLQLGVRPDAGNCYGCTPAFIRKLTGQIDQYELKVQWGEVDWPWSGKGDELGDS